MLKHRIEDNILTVSESKSTPTNPVMSHSSTQLEIACNAEDESLLLGCRPVEPLTNSWGLASNSPLRWFSLCKTLPLGPWALSLTPCSLSSASFFLFCSRNLFASAAVQQPAARASCVIIYMWMYRTLAQLYSQELAGQSSSAIGNHEH